MLVTSSRAASGIAQTFRALAHRNYRLFFIGQGTSLMGTWMQSIAMTWLIYRLTNSVFLLGVVGFASQLPTFLFSSVAGVIADRVDKRRILILTQSFALAQALLLAVLTLMGYITVWHIITLGVFMGFVNAFDMPTRQAFLVEMIEDKADLGNAIALNSSMFNSARLVGPSVAGVLVGIVGEGWCFLINALSFLAVIAALMAMRLAPPPPAARSGGMLRGWTEGFRYAWSSLPIRVTLLLLAVSSLAGMPYAVLMPVFARDVLGGGPHTLGFLMGSAGIGALAGALTLASRKNTRSLARRLPLFTGLFGAGLLAFGVSRLESLSLLMLAVVGFGMMTTTATCNTILQTSTSDEMRGRVMSLYTMAFMGMMPFGSLIGGSLAARIGAPATVLASGSTLSIAAFALLLILPRLRRRLHPK